jgi:hypothetical protein
MALGNRKQIPLCKDCHSFKMSAPRKICWTIVTQTDANKDG